MNNDCFASAKIDLLEAFYPIVRFEADARFKGWGDDENPNPEPNIELTMRNDGDDKSLYWVHLHLTLAWPDNKIAPYSQAELMVIGIFQLPKDVTQEEKDLQLTVSAPSVLYSGARQLIKTITGHGPFSAMTLPLISFNPGTFFTPEEKPVKQKKTSAQKVSKKKTAKKKTH